MNGDIFEDMVIERLERLDGYKHSTQKQDKQEGCDFYYYGVPIDITLRDKKSLSTPIGSIELRHGYSANLSIRWGNARAQFITPVIVMHFSLTNIQSAREIVPFIDDIVLDAMTDMYWTELDKREEKGA